MARKSTQSLSAKIMSAIGDALTPPHSLRARIGS
jgi:hypothetical protein